MGLIGFLCLCIHSDIYFLKADFVAVAHVAGKKLPHPASCVQWVAWLVQPARLMTMEL